MAEIQRRRRTRALNSHLKWAVVLPLLISCTEVPEQGGVVGEIIADGVSRQVTGAVSAATVAQGDGWAALEVWTLTSSGDGQDSPDIGPLCLWVQLDAISSTGPLDLGAPWAVAVPPYTLSEWYCLPGGETAPFFVGIRCDTPQAEEAETPQPGVQIDLTPIPPPVTPTILPNPGYGADGSGTQTPVPGDTLGTLVGVGGAVEVLAPATGPCDQIELRLSGVVFENQSCEGPVTTLELVDVTITANLLAPGRDWLSGGYAACTSGL